MTKNNPYVRMLLNRVLGEVALQNRQPRDVLRAVLHNIICEDYTYNSRPTGFMRGARSYQRELHNVYNRFIRSDDFDEFIDWINENYQMRNLLRYYSIRDYESLDLLAEAFTAKKYEDEIINQVCIILGW